jgi:hypothetical protein
MDLFGANRCRFESVFVGKPHYAWIWRQNLSECGGVGSGRDVLTSLSPRVFNFEVNVVAIIGDSISQLRCNDWLLGWLGLFALSVP